MNQPNTDGKPSVPKVSLCMIVRDSSDTLGHCLETIKPWVDEMIVVDTGSVDNTIEIAESHGAQVSHFPWIDDFSAARNFSIECATGEWIFWMDSDDEIDPISGEKLRQLANAQHPDDILGYVMQVHCRGSDFETTGECTIVDHIKMFRNRPEIRFEGRIHEQILMPIRRLGGEVKSTDIYVNHFGASTTPDELAVKYERDLRILSLDVAERPEHPFVHFNLGMTYCDMQSWDLATESLQECLRLSDGVESHVPKTYSLLFQAYAAAKKYQQALALFEQAEAAGLADHEMVFRKGVLHQSMDDHEKAVQAFEWVLNSDRRQQFNSLDQSLCSYKAKHNVAISYQSLGRLDDAEMAWRSALQEAPQSRAAWRGLFDVLAQAGRRRTLELELDAASQDQVVRIESVLFRARIARDQSEFGQAIELLKSAFDEFGSDGDLLAEMAQLCFIQGLPADAEPYLDQLVEVTPNDPSVLFNLAQSKLACHKYQEAKDSFEKSLSLRPGYQPAINGLEQIQMATT